EFLHQGSVVDAQIDRARLNCACEILSSCKVLDLRSAATDIRLHDDGKNEAAGCFQDLRGMVDHPGAGVAQPQVFKNLNLRALGSFNHVSVVAVDDSHSHIAEVAEELAAEKYGLCVASKVRRWAQSAEHHGAGKRPEGRVI